MAEEIALKDFNAVEDGSTDWGNIRENFTDLEEVINEHVDELRAIVKRQTFTVSKLFASKGKHVFLTGGKHLRCRPVNAYAVVHDNVDREVRITLDLGQEIKFSATEKKGSAKDITLHPHKAVHFTESVFVEFSEDRRVSVYVTFESIEEG